MKVETEVMFWVDGELYSRWVRRNGTVEWLSYRAEDAQPVVRRGANHPLLDALDAAYEAMQPDRRER